MEERMRTVTVLCLMLSGIGALQVSIPKDTYEVARGDDVSLPCSFQSKVKTPPLVIITWSLEGVEANAKELQILVYYSNSKQTDIKSIYEGRVSLDVDIAKGKADLKLSSVTLADNKVFECRVLIPGDDEGKPADTARLVVLVAPSTPICEVQGKKEYGQNINLTCVSEEGSPPPVYKWESRDVRNVPRARDPRTTDKGGILSLYNITKETSGFYVCTSSNKIRSATCNITLSVMPPSMNIGSTAGIICGVIIALIILIVIIYFCCCRKKKKEEEYAMGVTEESHRDKEPAVNGEGRRTDGDGDGDSKAVSPAERYEERSEPRADYDDRRSDYDDRRSDYDDRRSDYNDRRSDYDDRRSDYDDRRSDYTDRRDKYSDRRERYDDERRYDDSRDRRNDDRDRYDEPYDDRSPDTPARKEYHD